jgi:hypothetical protein
MNYWVTYSDKNYMKNTDILLSLLNKFSKVKLLFFTLDFEYENNYENVIPIYYNLNGKGIPEIKFLKAELCQKALEYDNDANFCFLDADIIPTRNCDSIFDNISSITNYPLVTRHAYDWISIGIYINDILVNDDGLQIDKNHESNLLNYIGSSFDKRSVYYKQTCALIFNNKCEDLINQWTDLCNNKFIFDNKNKFAPVHEESILNALLWKYDYNNCLQELHIDVPHFDHQNVFDFIHTLRNPKDYTDFFCDWVKVPSKEGINNICFFHGLIHNDKVPFIYFLEKYFQNE